MSKARQLADLGNQVDDGAITGTNMVVNGAMNVAQRGTSKTGIVSSNTSFPTCDRVKFYNVGGTGPTYTVTQEADAPDGFKYSWKIETTTADSSLPATHYSLLRLGLLEYQDTRGLQYNTASAKKATLSFWVKSSIAGDQDFVLTAHGNLQREHGQTLTINSANTWEYKTFVFDGDTDTTNTPDSEPDVNHHLSIDIRITAGANYQGGTLNSTWGSRASDQVANNCLQIGSTANATFQITGVCLNVGDSAIAFPHESYGETLAKCQRYFEIVKPEAGQQASGIAVGYHLSTTGAVMHYFYKVTKRTKPDFTVTGQSNIRINHTGTSRNISSGAITISSSSGVDTARMILTGASGSLGDGDGSSMTFTGDGSLQFNAEL